MTNQTFIHMRYLLKYATFQLIKNIFQVVFINSTFHVTFWMSLWLQIIIKVIYTEFEILENMEHKIETLKKGLELLRYISIFFSLNRS